MPCRFCWLITFASSDCVLANLTVFFLILIFLRAGSPCCWVGQKLLIFWANWPHWASFWYFWAVFGHPYGLVDAHDEAWCVQGCETEENGSIWRPYWEPCGSFLGSFGWLFDHFGLYFCEHVCRHALGSRFGSKIGVSGGGLCVISV